MLIAGALGLQKTQMAHGALLAISGGLLLAVPTAGTGLLDWWAMERGTPKRRVATIHLMIMVSATLVFAGAWLAQRPGYVHGDIRALGLILGLIAEAILAIGGWLGGSIVFVHGHRVLPESEPSTPRALGGSASASMAAEDDDQLVERVRELNRPEPDPRRR